MRKIFFLLIPLVLLAGCSKYSSSIEANQACWAWASESNNSRRYKDFATCQLDAATNQVLGRIGFMGKTEKRFYY